MSTATIVVGNREQLDTLLVELVERGIEPATYATAGGNVGLLAPYGEDGEWDAFESHPYSTEFGPVGLARQHDMETLAADGELQVEGEGFDILPVILAVNLEREHPGLDGLRFPLTVIHEDRA
jgi:hypothetical protein